MKPPPQNALFPVTRNKDISEGPPTALNKIQQSSTTPALEGIRDGIQAEGKGLRGRRWIKGPGRWTLDRLAESLGEPTEKSQNPLSRRYRGTDRGGGGIGKMTEENPRIQKQLEKFCQFLRNVPSTVTPRPSTVTPRSRQLREEEQLMLGNQMLRQWIIMGLKELYELAIRYARSRRVSAGGNQI